VLAPGELTVVANTGDDVEWWGLHVSPDTDAVLFRLGGLFNVEAGFGIVEDAFTTMDQLRSLGEDAWFNLGNRDLAFHILRSDQLRRGARLSETALDLGRRLGLATRVLPMSDDPVRTWFVTDHGAVPLQDYFVRQRAGPSVRAVDYAGLAQARPSPEAVAAVRDADLVVIGPSNPVASVWPILHLLGPHLHRGHTVAVSPTVGGRALKGPTVEMMRSLGRDPSPAGVAAEYRALAGWFVLDAEDVAQRNAIGDLGYRVLVTDTLMPDAAAAEGLAGRILEFATSS
jgi:LPPG:FO 2-phospho-L-lactate transferase